MKIQTLTSICAITQAAFYKTSNENYRPNSKSFYPRPKSKKNMLVNDQKIPTTVSPKPAPRKNIHQDALCGKITDFRQVFILRIRSQGSVENFKLFYSLSRGSREVLKSPLYPHGFDSQVSFFLFIIFVIMSSFNQQFLN